MKSDLQKSFYLKLRAMKCKLYKIFYRLPSIHDTTYINKGCDVARDLVTHEYVYIGPECIIGPSVELGAYTMLGPRVIFTGDDHVFDSPETPIIFSGRPTLRPTIVGRDVWIGAQAVIMAGVTVGDGAIIAAGAVVKRDIDPCEIHGGIPSKKIRDRFKTIDQKKKHLEMLKQKPIGGEFCPQIKAQ